MAPVGNNGPYIPRLDLENANRKPSSLAIKNVTPRSPLADITSQPRTGGGNRTSGASTSNTNPSGVGGASRVGTADASNFAVDPLAAKAIRSDQDTITRSAYNIRATAQARMDGRLPPDPNMDGGYTAHPVKEYIADVKVLPRTGSALADGRIEIQGSGTYMMSGAVQPQIPEARPVQQSRKRSFGMAFG